MKSVQNFFYIHFCNWFYFRLNLNNFRATSYPGNKDLAYFETGNPTSLEKSLQRLLEDKNK